MKKLFFVFALIPLLTSCKKATKEAREDLVILAMTDGQWKVSSFTLNGTTITSDFTNYRFKYFSNRTVDAINNGTVEKTGTWEGNSSTMTISASFSGAILPLFLLNGTWTITRNGWTYVEATLTAGSEVRTLRLDKV